jgi:hypothetical protein
MIVRKTIEKWAPCPAPFNKHYEVSNYGNVRSLERVVDRKCKGKVLKKSQPRKSYWNSGAGESARFMVTLQVPGLKAKTKYLHLLVAESFVKKPKGNGVFVLFKDNNPRNVCAFNLKWSKKRGPKKTLIDKKMAVSLRRMYQSGVPLKKISELTGLSVNAFAPVIYNYKNNQHYNPTYKPKKHTAKRKAVSKKNKKLSKTKVKSIRKIKNKTYQEIADKFGVGKDTVGDIKRMETWVEVK